MHRISFSTIVAAVFVLSVASTVAAPLAVAAGTPTSVQNRTLVVVELAGGNDGLNMVVPYSDPLYYKDRPTIAIPKTEVLPLGNGLGLNPAMKSLAGSWDAKDLAFILGVGYPHPNRSHFRSIDIWNTASDSNQYLNTGWIARMFKVDPRPSSIIADSLIIGEDHVGPLAGSNMRNLALNSISGFVKSSRLISGPTPPTARNQPAAVPSPSANPLGYIESVEADIRDAVTKLRRIQDNLPVFKTKFPATEFGRQVELAAQMLAAGRDGYVPVVKLTVRGFDTHGGERLVQDHFLRELSDGLSAFRSAMKEKGLWDRVVVMTYSEFGRRVAENFSKGTDHGTAGPMLVMGGNVRGGFYGREPSLTDLDHGDLKYTTDFRRVYATIASRFFGIQSEQMLRSIFGHQFAPIPFLRSNG